MTAGLFDESDTDHLRTALAAYTVDAINTALGPGGQAALGRGDLIGAARQLLPDEPVATLIRLFILGREVPEPAARAALHPLPLESACAAGVVAVSAGSVRALLDIRPYAQVGRPESPGKPWWVVSDFGSDVRGSPLAPDHVLGVGAASLTLAQATPRDAVSSALDIGTGSGVQALHLGTHADRVVATDISERALRFAATTAALSGQHWDLRHGSLLEPVAGARFDLVVANPPFVVGSGGSGYDYRDGGLSGDGLCEALVRALPSALTEQGMAQLLANWIIPADQPWDERLARWLVTSGCDAWVWQREVADPGEYVTLWLRDSGEQPGTERWTHRYDAWLDWFGANDVVAIGMGLITMWRTDAAQPAVVLEDVPQALEQPIGAQLPRWIARQRWLAATADADLLTARLVQAADLERTISDLLTTDGWAANGMRVRQLRGLRWELDIDDAISALIAGCAASNSLAGPLEVLAAALGRSSGEVAAAALPVVRDLIGRGFLIPVELAS